MKTLLLTLQPNPRVTRNLQDIDLAMTEQALAKLLEMPTPIYLTSDGGAVPGKGSFGWVIQVGDTIIACGKGLAYGPDPCLFGAKGYGMGSGLLFLYLLQQHFSSTWNPQQSKLICNNKGLLMRIKKTMAWKYLQPKVTLRAKWDIESLILDFYRQLGWQFQFTHVRSHQDDSIPLCNLPMEAQQNVEADRLATEFLTVAKYAGRASLFPSAKCQLLIDGATVSQKLPMAIHFQVGKEPLQSYLRQRNTWSQETLEFHLMGSPRLGTLLPSGTAMLSYQAMSSTSTPWENVTPQRWTISPYMPRLLTRRRKSRALHQLQRTSPYQMALGTAFSSRLAACTDPDK
jgi:hypothetical protein